MYEEKLYFTEEIIVLLPGKLEVPVLLLVRILLKQIIRLFILNFV